MTTETQLSQVDATMKGRPALRGWLQRHSLLAYGLIAYGITWSILLGTVFAIQSGLLAPDTPLLGLAAEAAVYGPAVAALLVLAVTQGRVGATDPVQFQNDYSLITVFTFGLLMAIVIAATHGRLGYRSQAPESGQDQVGTRIRS